jgi:hypothetical protein
MSTDKWRQRLDRHRQSDFVITCGVIIAVVLMVVHEILIARVAEVPANTQGWVSRVLIGLIAAANYFRTRTTHGDVLHDVSATTEVRDRVTKIDEDTDRVVHALSEDRRVERHDWIGQVNQANLKRQEAELKLEAAHEKIALLLTTTAAGPRGEKGDKGEPGDAPKT